MMDFAERFSIVKPVCPEWLRVHEGVAFQEQVGDQLAHGGGLQKTVSGESRCVQEVPGSAGSADQGIVIGRVLMETGPAPLQLQADERRGDDSCRLIEGCQPLMGELPSEARTLAGIGDPEQQTVSGVVEVQGAAQIEGERHRRHGLHQRCGEADLPADRNDGQQDPCHLTDALRPGPGGTDHGVSPHKATVRADRRHPVVVGVDPSDFMCSLKTTPRPRAASA
jgi:hypothetical protein